MSSTDTNASQQVDAAVELIAQALDQIAGSASAHTVYCEIQARAARDALITMAADPNTRSSSSTNRSLAEALTPNTEDVGELLAEAELMVSKLPAYARNQVAVCAAMSYLRRARRALGET